MDKDFYKTGVRLLKLTSRDHSCRGDKGERLISTNPQEFDRACDQLLDQMMPGERLYSSVNARDWKNAIKYFKAEQAALEFCQDDKIINFYTDTYNRFCDYLETCVDEVNSLYLIEIDNNGLDDDDFLSNVYKHFYEINVEILTFVHTPYGCQVVTKRKNVNYKLFQYPDCKYSIKYDGMIFLEWE